MTGWVGVLGRTNKISRRMPTIDQLIEEPI